MRELWQSLFDYFLCLVEGLHENAIFNYAKSALPGVAATLLTFAFGSVLLFIAGFVQLSAVGH